MKVLISCGIAERGEYSNMAVNILTVDPNQFAITPKTSEDFELANFYGYLADGSRHHFTDTELRTVHNMLQRWGTSGIKNTEVLDNFSRFYNVYPDMEMAADLKSYIFITRPEMNLIGPGAGLSNQPTITLASENQTDTRLQYLAAMHPELMYMLTEEYSNEHQFIPYLQSRAESMQLPDYEIRTSEFTVPFYNYKFNYPTVTNESITGGTFTITFREDSELRIMNLFQFWIYYMDAVMKNKMKPTREHILDNSYDFMCSVYEIITDPTSERILFWSKYTGCYPTAVPLSNMSHNLRSTIDNKVGVTFSYMMVEMMEPRIITDFNHNSVNSDPRYDDAGYTRIFDHDFGVVGSDLVGAPSIVLSRDQHSLYLFWKYKGKGKSSTLSNSIPTLSNINKSLASSDIDRSDTTYDSSAALRAPTVSHTTLSSYILNNSDSIR